MKTALHRKINGSLLFMGLMTTLSFSSVGSAVPREFLEQKPHWACQTVKAFNHGFDLNPHSNMNLGTYGALITNSGTFEVRTMFNTPKGIRGNARLPSLGDVLLFTVLNRVGDRGLQGEIQIETTAIPNVASADLRAQFSKAPTSVSEPQRVVLFNVYCASEDREPGSSPNRRSQ